MNVRRTCLKPDILDAHVFLHKQFVRERKLLVLEKEREREERDREERRRDEERERQRSRGRMVEGQEEGQEEVEDE